MGVLKCMSLLEWIALAGVLLLWRAVGILEQTAQLIGITTMDLTKIASEIKEGTLYIKEHAEYTESHAEKILEYADQIYGPKPGYNEWGIMPDDDDND